MINFFIILLLSNLLIFFNLKKFSNFVNIYDKPDQYLKKHKSNVPLLGGIIIIINLLILFLLKYFLKLLLIILYFQKKSKFQYFY